MGPLPPAVYWRRRALVVLVLAVVVALSAVTCAAIRESVPPTRSGAPGATGSPFPASRTPAASPSRDVPSASAVAPTPAPTTTGRPRPSSSRGTAGTGDRIVATVACADAEMAVTAAVSPSPAPYGGVVRLYLIVRNTADHACYRDVGSAHQELQVSQNGELLWSSDHCGQPQTTDVRTFGPNIETMFWRTWNTYRIAPHECDQPDGAVPAPPGAYQLIARLGSRVSDPVTFEIRQ